MPANSVRVLSVSSPDLVAMAKRMRSPSKKQAVLRAATKEMKRFAAVTKQAILEEAPRKTGALAASVQVKVRPTETPGVAMEVWVGSKERNEVIVRSILYGSRRHKIPLKPGTPTAGGGHGGPLHFYWAKLGKWVTFTSVNHPGTKPNNFIKRAWGKLRAARNSLVDAIGGEIVTDWMEQ